MTRRFDRPGGDTKLHTQSLAGSGHYDFNEPGAYSYEQALLAIGDSDSLWRRLSSSSGGWPST